MNDPRPSSLPRQVPEPPDDMVARALRILEEESRAWSDARRRRSEAATASKGEGERS